MQITRKVRPEIMDSVALLVLDAQDSLIDGLHNKESFLQRCAFAIEAARCLRLHTLFTEQAPEKLGRTNRELFKLALNPRVFSKQTFSALAAPGLERYLREKEIYHLLVVGLEVPICLYQTALQATEEDVDITFLADAISSRRPQDEKTSLDAIIRLGCQVLPSETVFYSLIGDAQNPYFRAFTQIVKAFGDPDFDLESYLKDRPQPEEVGPAASDASGPRPGRDHRPGREGRDQRQNRSGRDERGPSEPREPAARPTREDREPPEPRSGRDRDFREPHLDADDDESAFEEDREAQDGDEDLNEDVSSAGPDESRSSEGDQGERRRKRRRRGRGRNRDREGGPESRSPTDNSRSERPQPAAVSENAPRPPRHHAERTSEPARAERAAPPPTRAEPPRRDVPTATKAPAESAATREPAAAAAETPAKKAAKKAVKRVAKKAARKTAAKKAAKTAPDSSEG